MFKLTKKGDMIRDLIRTKQRLPNVGELAQDLVDGFRKHSVEEGAPENENIH